MKKHLLRLIRFHAMKARESHKRADYYSQSLHEGYRNAYVIVVNGYLKPIAPTSPNWENSIESFLTRN